MYGDDIQIEIYMAACMHTYKYRFNLPHNHQVPFGLVVRIPGFHPGGPGSIPGMGSFCFLTAAHYNS